MDENLPTGGASGPVPPSPKPTEVSSPGEPISVEVPAAVAPTLTEPSPAAPDSVSSAPPPVLNAPPPVNTPPPQYNAPPPPRVPPPIFMGQPAPSSGKGRGWKIFAILLLIGLGLSMMLNMQQFVDGSGSSGRKSVHYKRLYLEEVPLEENNSDNKIAVVSIEGVISSQDNNQRYDNMVEDVRRQFKAARKDSDVRAVILKVNSPGGEVLASDEIYHMIEDFQRETRKPVIASMQTLAASGGYYVSAPCRWIVANELTITGSIGVIMHGFNFSTLMDKIGVRSETYKSGEFKDMLSPFRHKDEIPPEEKRMVQSLIMETYDKFTNIVEVGRGDAFDANSKSEDKGQALDESWTEYVDGRVMSGRQAYELGFVDELGDFRTAVARAQKLANITDANLIEYRQPFDLGDLFRLFGQTETPAIKVDLGLDFPKLQPGCLYFLYRQAIP